MKSIWISVAIVLVAPSFSFANSCEVQASTAIVKHQADPKATILKELEFAEKVYFSGKVPPKLNPAEMDDYIAAREILAAVLDSSAVRASFPSNYQYKMFFRVYMKPDFQRWLNLGVSDSLLLSTLKQALGGKYRGYPLLMGFETHFGENQSRFHMPPSRGGGKPRLEEAFQTLGLTTTATLQEARKEYYSWAKKLLNPDSTPKDEESKTKWNEVSAAYNVIYDELSPDK